jgi:hypothetical protein
MHFSAAYDDNVFPGGTAKPVSDLNYSIFPTISFQQTRPRQSRTFRYSPGFTLYQRTSELNVVNQNAHSDFQYRLSPRTTFSVQDTFQQNSNAFTQPDLSGAAISGSTQNLTTGVIAPYAETIGNDVQGSVSYQFSRNGMIGGSGSFDVLNYPNSGQASGLYNFKTSGGSAFFNRRLSSTQYAGAQYQYARTETHPLSTTAPAGSTTQINGILLFYTLYLNRTLSFSLSGGTQHFDLAIPGAPATNSWTPAGTGSMGWQTKHFNLAASASRTVSAGNGFYGAFNSKNANASLNWQFSRIWSAGFGGAYMITKSVTPHVLSSTSDGHSVSGNLSVERRIGEHLTASLGYTRLHQSYAQIAAISTTPDANRGYLSVDYTFTRPLGK